MKHDLSRLSAVQARDAIHAGRISSEALVKAFLARIEETENAIKAWAFLDVDGALEQARESDRIRRAGHAVGALHGIPVGLKDIVDTRDMPTECGTSVFAGRRPDQDARLVERLREAGAIILGKTATTEFAYMHPAQTTNPWDAARTPGGSSSGSAAAVAAQHVPLAVGSQTGGSVIRPASFCGVFGFKPTRGTISRSGVFRTSETLDHVGVFANCIDDIALLTSALGSYDQTDPASFARPRADFLSAARSDVPVEPDIAWFDMPYHDRLEPETREGIEAVIDALGARVERFDVAPQLADLSDVHKLIYDYEISQNLAEFVDAHGPEISEEMRDAVARGAAISEDKYADALGVRSSALSFFKDHFNDFDAILAPSASGEALPLSDGSTGDSVYCTPWTLAGLPCLTLPVLVGGNDLPVGVQLIGAMEEDDRLLRTSAWVQTCLAGPNTEREGA